MRSIWTGAISFGLVVIPVKLYAATEQRDITFRQVHREDGARIQFRRFCTLDGEEVPYSDIAKGYELPTGDMVVLTDEDLADLPLVTAHRIEVLHFAPARSGRADLLQQELLHRARAGGRPRLRAVPRRPRGVGEGGGGQGRAAPARGAGRAAGPGGRDHAGDPAVAGRGAQARVRLPRRGHRGPVAGAEDGRLADRHDDRGFRARPVPRRLPGGARGRRPGQGRGQRRRPPGRPGPARGQEAARRPDRDPAGQRRGGQGRRRPRQIRRSQRRPDEAKPSAKAKPRRRASA